MEYTFWDSLSSEWKEVLLINIAFEKERGILETKEYDFWKTPIENYQSFFCQKKLSQDLPKEELVTLRKLDIFGTGISDLNGLQQLSGLNEFYMGNTSICNLSTLEQMTSLEKLCCYNAPLSDISPIKSISSLKRLCISKTNISEISALSELVNLEKLSMYKTKVEDISPLRGLNKLEKVNINFTNVSDLSPLYITFSLKELHCFQSKVSDDDIIRFQRNNPNCIVFNEFEESEKVYDDFE